FAGNTTMLHFLMNLPAAGIAVSPFIPVTTGPHTFKAIDLSIDINPKGSVIILPSVSAYIGADTTAAVLAGGIYSAEKMSLIIDIGTNGEMVLGNKKRMISCSTAAGPAFEGANIRNGTGGITGAIDSIKIASELEYTTIGNRPAVGLCGSGLVDAIAAMLSLGIIDETGRILNPEEIEGNLPHPILKRLVKIDNKTAFVIEWKENCESDSDIAITQKDVREFQNAKAAIAAGIKILASRMQIKTGDIQKAFLAGGFGSYINVDSAHKVGLLPDELRGRVESIGNAAGEGAVEALLSSKRLGLAEKIRNRIEYIELSTAGDFSDEYIECLMF
ncbi:MAG: ASKHA domain-containing protein, partial [Bacillota bacterium]|nr:ASKHA domain-containing protein [Bacillota bacterium]